MGGAQDLTHPPDSWPDWPILLPTNPSVTRLGTYATDPEVYKNFNKFYIYFIIYFILFSE